MDAPPHGTDGHTPGAGALVCPTNLPTTSFVPPTFAGEFAHHVDPVPSRSRTATLPCAGSFSVYPKPAPRPRTRTESALTVMRWIGSVVVAALNRSPFDVSVQPAAGNACVVFSPEPFEL